MSLPKLGTWATAETNYPGSAPPAWLGQPVIIAPTADIFTPDTPLPAQYLNFLFNKLFAQDIAITSSGTLAALVTLQSLASWSTITSAADFGPNAAVWNDTSIATDSTNGQRWIVADTNIAFSQIHVWSGWGDPNTGAATGGWTQFGGAISYTKSPTSLAVDSAGAIYLAGVGGVSATEADIWKCPVGGTFAFNINLTGLTTPTDLQIATLGTALFYAIGSSTGASASISGGFGGGFTGLTASSWIVRSNGTIVLFVPAVAMATPTVYNATGTATFSSASIGLATTDVPQDLTWSAALGAWFLVAKTSGGASTIWTSSNGTAWTIVKTLSSLPHPIVSLVSVGPWLVGAMSGLTGTAQVVTSVDGGATWDPVPTGFVVGSNTAARLFASPTQILAIDLVTPNQSTASSFRLSSILGLGDQALS